MDYIREKVIVKLTNGKEYHFVTECESNSCAIWMYHSTKEELVIYNDNGARFHFPLVTVVYYYSPYYYSSNKTTTIKEINKGIYEVNDYVKCK